MAGSSSRSPGAGSLQPGQDAQGSAGDRASVLNDWLRFYVEDQAGGRLGEIPADADTEPVRLSFAA